MVLLIKTTIIENYGINDTIVEIITKSHSFIPLRKILLNKFKEALENMTEDDLINDCSKEDFDDDNGFFEKDKLVIMRFMPSPGLERKTEIYQILSDDIPKFEIEDYDTTEVYV